MHVDSEILNITIRGHVYPVQKTGVGIPCLILCLGSPSLRTISAHFSQSYAIYSSDLYWIKNATYPDEPLTIDIILDDIKAQIDALKLEKCVLFAHSAYGIIALEFAKKYPDMIGGIIMIGTPVNCNAVVAEKNQKIFELEADAHRKEIDAQNKVQFKAIDKQSFTPEQLFLQEYIYRDAARYWYDAEFNCSDLWKGIALGPRLVELFLNILPNIEVLDNLSHIQIPIVLAAGLYDFDCCPWEWNNVEKLPPRFEIIRFKHSGHWPQYEESESFDSTIGAWIDRNLLFYPDAWVKGMLKTVNKMGITTLELAPPAQDFVDYAYHCEYPIVDIGCGYGVSSLAALKTGAKVIAIDLAVEHLEVLQKNTPEALKNNLTVQVSSFPEAFDFPDSSISAVHASMILHFLSGEQILDGLKKIYASLKPGGKLFIANMTPYLGLYDHAALSQEYNNRLAKGEKWPGYIDQIRFAKESWKKQLPPYAYFFKIEDAVKLVSQVGFEIEKVYYYSLKNIPDEYKTNGKEYIGLTAIK